MNPVRILPTDVDWPSAIGNFLLNFGTLEYLVFVFLKDHFGAEEFGRSKELHLKDRLKKITQQLVDENYPAEQQTAFAVLVKRLEPIRELRNHLAHGHLYVRFDEKTKKCKVTVFKAKDLDTGFMPNSRHVEFDELEAALQTLGELIEEFERLAGFSPPRTFDSAGQHPL